MPTTLERVTKVVVDKLQRNQDEVVPSASFEDDLAADSLDMVDLVLGFEDEFGIVIPDEDASAIRTVGEAVEYVEQRLAAV